MTRRKVAFVVLIVAAVFALSAACQENQSLGEAARKERERRAQQRPPARVITNDDIKKLSSDDVPEIPGMQKCAEDVACFLTAVDKGKPASLSHQETVEEGTGIITARSTWWTAGRAPDKCRVWFRVDAFKAEANAKVLERLAGEKRKEAEARLAEANRDFEPNKGKAQSCTLPKAGVRKAFEGPRLSFVLLGGLANMGKGCTGPMFQQGPATKD